MSSVLAGSFWTLRQVLESVCPLDWQCIRVNSQVIKSPLSPSYPFSCWVYGWLLSTIWSSWPGLGGKQSLSYSAELMPVWLNALDTNSRGFWSLHIIVFRAYGASLIVLLPFWPSSAEANPLYHQNMTIVCCSNHLKIQRAWILHHNWCHFGWKCRSAFLKLGFISSRCVAENEHLFTSPDTLSVYLIANTIQIVT